MNTTTASASLILLAATLGGCAMAPQAPMNVPDAVKVPAGHAVYMNTVGEGQITYECRAKKDMADQFEWVFVGPDAKLSTRQGQVIGRYFGPPATWAANDGSAFTGAQLATAPGGAGNIPLQLVKANPATGSGQMQGVTYVQRLATQGGVAPAMPCMASSQGSRQVVAYKADYVLWRAAM